MTLAVGRHKYPSGANFRAVLTTVSKGVLSMVAKRRSENAPSRVNPPPDTPTQVGEDRHIMWPL